MPALTEGFPRRALLLLGIGLLMLLTVGGSSIYLLRSVGKYSETLYNLHNARIQTYSLMSDLQDAETGQRGYLLTNDSEYFVPYRRASRHIETAIQLLAENPISHIQAFADLERALAQVADEKMSELRETSELQTQKHHDEAMQIVMSDRGKQLMDRARDLVSQINGRIDQRRAEERGSLRLSSNVLQGVAWVGLLAAIMCGVGVMLVVSRSFQIMSEAQAQMEQANLSLERRVKERTADLQASNEEVQRFAYIVSHDLRAPLVNIMGFTAELEAALASIQVLLACAEQSIPTQVTDDARLAINQDLPEAVNFIRSSTQRMDRLINAILKLSREGRRSMAPEPLQMEGLMKSLVASVQHQLADVSATIEVDPTIPDIVSDRVALEQVFGNLIDNAVKYLDHDRKGSITIAGERNPKGIRYQIEDNGRGIEERDRERVFELFRRAGKQDRPGDGIGLAHVRALVRRLGGTIDFKSVAGQGTTFFVQLPATLSVSAVRS